MRQNTLETVESYNITENKFSNDNKNINMKLQV